MEFESSVDKMSDNLLALVSSVVAFQCSVILNSKNVHENTTYSQNFSSHLLQLDYA